uniref:Uncharacterized protein n=1 Tax=Magallana gigas TaxID=29159 RepID=K1RHL7_MAGGI
MLETLSVMESCNINPNLLVWGSEISFKCDIWYHTSCMFMTTPEYIHLANTSKVWICSASNTPHSSKIYNSISGAGGGKIAKDVAWREVAQTVNGSSGSGILRTSGEAAKQYSNLKQRAKGKLSEAKRPKTGGGPKPPSPTPVELSILEQLEGRPSLEGICGGIDTADPVETQPSTSSSASLDVPAKKKDVQDSGKKKRKLTILELEERNLSLENDKLQEEIEKLKDERQLIVAKKSYYDLNFQILCNNNPEINKSVVGVPGAAMNSEI